MAGYLASSSSKKPVTAAVVITETPFDKRYCCWFCGEPSHVQFIFPPDSSPNSYHKNQFIVMNCPHPTISIPCCGECRKLAVKAQVDETQVDNIWAVHSSVKKQLLKLHAKDLAIGVNWTQEELSTSEFEQGNFAGFAKSAWFIYEVAKGRVSYISWPLVVNGIELDASDHEVDYITSFNFDGVIYPSIFDAIEHYGTIFSLDKHYVSAVLHHMADKDIDEKSFAKAIRFCRLLVNATPNERKVAFNELVTE